jgi:pimeloyl-ACP methyl ester carboxylesterase
MKFYKTSSGRNIAYVKTKGDGPTVVFLGGFMSDMEGSKATFLEDWAKSRGQGFLRFDYSGHGQSSGAFEDGCIGDWLADARAIVDAQTDGDVVLVGSSMGGWISLMLAKELQERVVGLVTIAAAPDFTEDGFWAGFSQEAQRQLMEEGVLHVPSDYGDPYPITRRLIEDGRRHLIMRSALKLSMPIRMVQGTEDGSVKRETALALLDHIVADDIELALLKGADHSFSTPECLEIIRCKIEYMLKKAKG